MTGLSRGSKDRGIALVFSRYSNSRAHWHGLFRLVVKNIIKSTFLICEEYTFEVAIQLANACDLHLQIGIEAQFNNHSVYILLKNQKTFHHAKGTGNNNPSASV